MARSSRRRAKRELLDTVDELIRRMGAQSVLTSQIVADRFGLHTTDLEVLDLLALGGRSSPSGIARATGLTSGSVTALIDRLEVAGYVEREPDPDDRRRTNVVVRREAIEPIAHVYEPMQERMHALWAEYDDDALRLIADFLARSTALGAECAEAMRAPNDGE